MLGIEHDEGHQMEMEEQERSESLEEEEQQYCPKCQTWWEYNPKTRVCHICDPHTEQCQHFWTSVSKEIDKCARCGKIMHMRKEPPKLTDPDWREHHEYQLNDLKTLFDQITKHLDRMIKEIGKCK